jgi:hypothetical protein
MMSDYATRHVAAARCCIALCYRTRMSRFDAKLREFLESLFGPGQHPELVRESDWSYVYKGEKSYARISKFSLDETFAVSASEIRSRWPKMNEGERLDFASNFWVKENWNANDSEILEVIMQDGNDRLWGSCAQAFLKHSDRDRIVNFLIKRVEESAGGERLNYIQALGIAKERRAASAIKSYYEQYRQLVETESITGIPNDVVFGPIPYHAYFVACEALLKIDGSTEYDQAIRKYVDHPHQQVRRWANYALKNEEPTT